MEEEKKLKTRKGDCKKKRRNRKKRELEQEAFVDRRTSHIETVSWICVLN